MQYSKQKSTMVGDSQVFHMQTEAVVARKIVVVGGGAGGMGAAGGVKAADPRAEVVVYTGFDDVAYSPCGIPYVHGREIENFEKLFLASKQAYVDAGIDVHYNTDVTSVDVKGKIVQVASEGEVAWDTLVLATGFNYADPGVPGGDLGASTTLRTSVRPSNGTK